MKTRISILIAGVISTPFALFAHEGHGHDNPLGPGHYIGNPEHAIPLLLTVAVIAFFVVKRLVSTRTKKERRK